MMESEEIKSTFIGTLEEELNKKQREFDELDNAYRAEKRRDKLISYLIIFWNYTMVKACETVAQLDDRFVDNMVDMFNNKKYMEDRLTELKNDIQVCNSALNALKYHDHLCGHNVPLDPCCCKCGDCDGDPRRY